MGKLHPINSLTIQNRTYNIPLGKPKPDYLFGLILASYFRIKIGDCEIIHQLKDISCGRKVLEPS
jgi:hypothetical protein